MDVGTIKIRGATGFVERLRGWFGRAPDERGMWLYPCRIVHTLGMSEPITLIWLDQQGRVLQEHPNTPPNRIRWCWRAVSVVELASRDLAGYWAVKAYFQVIQEGGKRE